MENKDAQEKVFKGRTYRERSYTRKRKKLRRRIIGILFVTVLLAMGAIGVRAFLSGRVYSNEDEFKLYAQKQFDEDDLFEINGKPQKVYEYGTPISYAADYDISENESVESFRQTKIDQIREEWKEKLGKEKGSKDALIVRSAIYKTGNGALSLVIHDTGSREEGLDMVKISSSVNTYLLSEKTGKTMVPEQVFLPDYRSICSGYAVKYIEKNYDEKSLSDNWKDYVSDSTENFNDFAVTEDDVIFFFKEGTLLNSSEGITSIRISKEELKDSFRSAALDRYVDPSKPMVALTYDDGPGGKSEEEILDCLENRGATATFFYTGNRVGSDKGKIERARRMGCEIGNHTWDHALLTKLSQQDVKEQIQKTNEAIKNACGAYPTLFRPSYGATNDQINESVGMPVIMWSLDTLDWKSRNADKIISSVCSGKNLDGKIILMHSLYGSTAEATKKIVPWLQENGYQTVTVSDLIKYKKGEDAQNGKVYR